MTTDSTDGHMQPGWRERFAAMQAEARERAKPRPGHRLHSLQDLIANPDLPDGTQMDEAFMNGLIYGDGSWGCSTGSTPTSSTPTSCAADPPAPRMATFRRWGPSMAEMSYDEFLRLDWAHRSIAGSRFADLLREAWNAAPGGSAGTLISGAAATCIRDDESPGLRDPGLAVPVHGGRAPAGGSLPRHERGLRARQGAF